MVSRRRLLQAGAFGLSATAGCLSTLRKSGRSLPNDVGDGETQTPGDVPEWTPAWTLPFDDWHVLGLDTADGLLYVTLSKSNGPSSIAAVDPDSQSVRWQTESEGEAVAGSHVPDQQTAKDQWGVTLTEDTVYAVAGPVEKREWSSLHALSRADGMRRWSLKRKRELSVAGVVDGLVVATGLEFFPPPGTTPVSHQTPESPLSTTVYGLDTATGTVRWTRTFTDVQDVAVGDGIYVADTDRLVGLTVDGKTQFTYDQGPGSLVGATTDRVFYVTGQGVSATVHGVSPDGSRDWRRNLPVDEILVDGDRLYTGGDTVAAIDADGTVVWTDNEYGHWLLLDPDRDTLYTRSQIAADAATAYDVSGSKRWTFDPPSKDAWPETATRDAVMVTAITGDHADEPFYTLYAVNANGKATAALGKDTVFDATGLDGTIYIGDGESNLVALNP
ncbi:MULTISPECIES: PQQ-like beta-propeller repeat protein [Halorussus]|uniref:PQQ-like beta-propeller repeat protein n=1 Tax=Halorussus TaxID=1070314 RepID=UPI00209D7EC1|nr:PQQ-like beta-propeller repeat protein [Halorussus vallis]USZ75011.1 PQQ-like beta-propeller repeat protein [Halorussus vallis]